MQRVKRCSKRRSASYASRSRLLVQAHRGMPSAVSHSLARPGSSRLQAGQGSPQCLRYDVPGIPGPQRESQVRRGRTAGGEGRVGCGVSWVKHRRLRWQRTD